MDLLSARSQRIIKNTETTCQCFLLWGRKPVTRRHACVRGSRGVRYMEQVRVGRPFILIGRRVAQQDSAGAVAARQSGPLSPASVKLKIKPLLSQILRFLAFRRIRVREEISWWREGWKWNMELAGDSERWRCAALLTGLNEGQERWHRSRKWEESLSSDLSGEQRTKGPNCTEKDV